MALREREAQALTWEARIHQGEQKQWQDRRTEADLGGSLDTEEQVRGTPVPPSCRYRGTNRYSVIFQVCGLW